MPNHAFEFSDSSLVFVSLAVARGLYGSFEPLVYRPPRYEEVAVYRWRRVLTKGTLTGKVLSPRQEPVAEAPVWVDEGVIKTSEGDVPAKTFTDGSGKFTLPDLPSGYYVLKADKVDSDGSHFYNQKLIEVVANTTTHETITLDLPDPAYRLAEIDVIMGAIDWEVLSAGLPQASMKDEKALRVGPGGTHNEATFKVVADDVHGMAIVKVDWRIDNSIMVTLIGRLYDGSWDPSDLDIESKPQRFKVPAGASRWWYLWMDNEDRVTINITVKNLQQQT